MEFTLEEKKMIVSALEEEYKEVTEAVNQVTFMFDHGVRFEGEILDRSIALFKGYEAFLRLEKKIFESLEDKEERERLSKEVAQSISQFNECKAIVGFLEDDEHPETDDSDGVLGDKAQD